MYYNQNQWFQLSILIMDSAVSALVFIITGITKPESAAQLINTEAWNEVVLVVILACMASFVISAVHRDFFKRGYLHELNRVFLFTTLVNLLVVMYIYATHNDLKLHVAHLLYFQIGSLVTIYGFHITVKKLYRKYCKGPMGTKLLVIADLENLESTCKNLQQSNMRDRAIGVVILGSGDVDSLKPCGLKQIVPPRNIIDYIVQNPVDEVLLSIDETKYLSQEIQTLRNQIMMSGSVFSLRLWSVGKSESQVLHLSEFGNAYIMSFADRKYSFILVQCKRLMDIVGGFVGSALTVLLSVFLIPAILIESPGPVFFKQKRVGRNGRVFTILKFRSMYRDAEERKAELMNQNKMQGLLFKMDNDPRITKVGKFIRRTSLDEFPQFFNVLKGDMSLVGTRPPTVDEFRQYSCEQKKRLCFRPGITGIWQTSGRNNITDFHDVLEMDLRYIKQWSIYLDVKLILKTVVVALFGKGAV